MAKAPAFQFYVKDWLSDPQLKMASFSTKGIWIDLLCFMWESPDRGKLTGTKEQMTRLLGVNGDEFQKFLDEAHYLVFCDISVTNNEIITLCNRRMYRDEKERKNNRLRQQRFRDKQNRNEKITPPSPSPSPSPSTNTKKYTVCFLKFYEAYPLKIEKKAAFKKWLALKKQKLLPSIEIILSAIEKQKLWRENAKGEFRPKWKHPATWLNKGCWEDEIPEDEEDGLSRFLSRHQNSE